MTYSVDYDDGKQKFTLRFSTPERLPQCGDIYRVVESTRTLAGHTHEVGDQMVVLERTGFVPHHRKSSLGNLLIRTKFGTSVWTEFDNGVATGRFRLIKEDPHG